MFGIWLEFLAVLGGFVGPGVLQVSGIEVFTSSEVEAVNGTEVKLKCTFKSEQPVSQASVAVSWDFNPLGQGAQEPVFYYHEIAYPPTEGRFKDHVSWSGDILKQDVSIRLNDILFTFNGTFICQVSNVPDVHGLSGEIVLKVVNKVAVSEMGLLAAVIGGAIAIVLLGLVVVLVVKHHRRNRDLELVAPRQLHDGALLSKKQQEKEEKPNFIHEKEMEAGEMI
ncbi:hypothetical protein DPEC_G00232290 [Dallia pectoralis]|uniref:Uncharacterized protein n=1 Tax=Dallia pectoralis TaxID=75939 RepID=A0ACC2FX96_DALPE|nr:hypothetical protein DPEC_G00232290 [Dallia pectoralis]